MKEPVYDFIGIGLGPFNLGLASLSAPLAGHACLFVDRADRFEWHAGMLLDDATMQTPFTADLVTMADPTSRFSYLNYAKKCGRLYSFCMRENFFLLRQEYNRYCQWVAEQLPNLRFHTFVEQIRHEEKAGHYELQCLDTSTGKQRRYRAERLVLGTGTRPWLPACCAPIAKHLVHSADYLQRRDALRSHENMAVIGSGQSAAEIFMDLLRDRPRHGYRLHWITRSPRFFPLEYTKFALEIASPDYIDHFHALPEAQRDRLLRDQKMLYKGINRALIDAIFDEMYKQKVIGLPDCALHTATELGSCQRDAQSGVFGLTLQHLEARTTSQLHCDAVVAATGYVYEEPPFLQGIMHRVCRDERGRFAVARNYSIDSQQNEIFVQNAELHTHGISAPDLSMACHRNSVILSEILGYPPYPIERQVAFQQFGAPRVAVRTGERACG